MQRIRLVYSKGDELKFTGNLDMMKVWERTFRRAGLKIAYSQGFHPQPKIHQALPLPLGFTSQNDLLDFWLDSDENLGEISKKLERALQPGITVQEYQVVPAALKPLQTLVTSAEYLVRMETESIHADLTERIEKLLRQNECLRERRGKQYDLRPLIESLQIDKDDTSVLLMTLAARPGATGRPEEVLDALGIAMQDIEIMRTGMILSE
jgi:radical SAM-linked protein